MDKTESPTSPRICLFSQRNLHREVYMCIAYEFEDVICEVDEVELFAPEPCHTFKVSRKLANQLTQKLSFPFLNPGIRKVELKRSYDLFFVWCQFPYDLLSLNAIRGWRERCRTSVCLLSEVWAGELHNCKGYLKILSEFDYVLLHCYASVEPMRSRIGGSCTYMPPGVDSIRFCPYPNPPARSIDVYSLGRKSMVTHKCLLNMAEQGQIFYIYDTIHKMNTLYYKEHRNLVANIAKRSRYFMVNPGKIDEPLETHGQREIGSRFFEGLAAGTVMIGVYPNNEAFRKHFDWPDAVIHVPYDTEDMAELLAELNSQPERLARISRSNVVQTLLRHDWVYRWREILDMAGLEPRRALVEREKRLKELAEMANNHEQLYLGQTRNLGGI